MKITKILLFVFVIVITYSSCERAQSRNLHNKMLRTELDKYSDIFDLARTKIEFEGFRYNFFSSAYPKIIFQLYLKPNHNNMKTIIEIRDEFIAFFHDSRENGIYYGAPTIVIQDKDTKIYVLSYRSDAWWEWWYQEHIGKQDTDIMYSVVFYPEHYGRPLIGKPIHNEKLNVLLDKYFKDSSIEHFDGFHSGTDYIRIRLVVQNNCNSETVLAIKDDLMAFFDDNRQELINEYGQFNNISIIFYRLENENYKDFFYLQYRHNEWEIKLYGNND